MTVIIKWRSLLSVQQLLAPINHTASNSRFNINASHGAVVNSNIRSIGPRNKNKLKQNKQATLSQCWTTRKISRILRVEHHVKSMELV